MSKEKLDLLRKPTDEELSRRVIKFFLGAGVVRIFGPDGQPLSPSKISGLPDEKMSPTETKKG